MPTYTDVFGGANVYPSDISYQSLTLTTEDVQLSWPTETALGEFLAARIIDVTSSTTDGLAVILPDARSVSPGETILFNCVGATFFEVRSKTGVVLVTLEAGEAWQIYLRDNTTEGGLWRVFQYGAGVSQAEAGALAGTGLVATGSLLSQDEPTTFLNTDYTAGTADRAKNFVWNGPGGALTLPDPGSVGNGWFVRLANQGIGALTVDSVGGALIDGLSTKNFNPNNSATIISTGTAYYTVGFGEATTFAFDFTSIDVAGTGNYVLSGAELNRIAYQFTGVLTGNRSIIVPNTIQQYWVTNLTTGPFTLTVKTLLGTGFAVNQEQAAILYSDGTNVVVADSAGVSTPIAIVDGGTGATTASGARINLGGTAIGIGVFTAVSTAAAYTALGRIPTVDGGVF